MEASGCYSPAIQLFYYSALNVNGQYPLFYENDDGLMVCEEVYGGDNAAVVQFFDLVVTKARTQGLGEFLSDGVIKREGTGFSCQPWFLEQLYGDKISFLKDAQGTSTVDITRQLDSLSLSLDSSSSSSASTSSSSQSSNYSDDFFRLLLLMLNEACPGRIQPPRNASQLNINVVLETIKSQPTVCQTIHQFLDDLLNSALTPDGIILKNVGKTVNAREIETQITICRAHIEDQSINQNILYAIDAIQKFLQQYIFRSLSDERKQPEEEDFNMNRSV